MSKLRKPSILTVFLTKQGHVSGADVSDKIGFESPDARADAYEFPSKGEAEQVEAEIKEYKSEKQQISEEIIRLEEKLERLKTNFTRKLRVEYKSNRILQLNERATTDPETMKRLESIESKIDELS